MCFDILELIYTFPFTLCSNITVMSEVVER